MTSTFENLPTINSVGVDGPPSVHDLEENSEVGRSRELFRRYLTTGNYDRSIKMYNLVGMPVFRKIMMGTVGKLRKKMVPDDPGNYFLDKSKSKLESATEFAYNESVYNEVTHSALAVASGTAAGIEAGFGQSPASAVMLVGVNLALVGLQRYNRARMLRTIDEELKNGEHYSSDYRNKFGIDALAEDNYYAD